MQNCTINYDYDGDGVINAEDTCRFTYNKQQRDADGDGIGNVCDDDIDGDGKSNPIGIVDDSDIVHVGLLPENEDNCLFIRNPEQNNSDGDTYGNACDPDQAQSMLALAIDAIPRIGIAPLAVSFSQDYVGTLENLSWDFDDGNRYS